MSSELASRVILKFNVPFVINLPNDFFEIQMQNYACGVRLQMKEAKDNPSGLQGDARVLNDRFGHTNYTMVTVEFPFLKPIKPNIQTSDSAKHMFIEAINRILEVCRFCSSEFFQRGIVLSDIGTITTEYYGDQNQRLTQNQEFEIPTIITTGNQDVLGEGVADRIKQILKSGNLVPLESKLMKNAEEYLLYGELRLCPIDIQSAVEYITHKIIREHLEKEKRKEEEINQILKNRFDDLKPFLKSATTDNILSTIEYTQWHQYCYKLRNEVVHKNKTPTYDEAKKAYERGVEFITLLKTFSS